MEGYRLNPNTGTMEKISEDVARTVEVESRKSIDATPLDIHTDTSSVLPTIQAFNIESDEEEREIVFKEKSHLNIVQIVDEDTGKLLGYISGYALDIGFNVKELKSTKKVEQCLSGLTAMFRKIIMDQIIGNEG